MKWLIAIFCTFFVHFGSAQLQYQLISSADGLPSKEVYEVFCDSKGFLWIGHAMGISRFDGNRFTNFHHPQQNSFGVSNILEDEKGRIWFRNFGAQIFYIEDNQIHLLHSYDWKMQESFPSFIISKNGLLLASHKQGLFVYNINDGSSRIEILQTKPGTIANYSLGIVNNIPFVIQTAGMYMYASNRFQLLKTDFKLKHKIEKFQIFCGSFKDCIYLLNASRDTVLCCTIQNNTLKEVSSFSVPQGFYNIASTAKDAWVCSKTKSYNLINSANYINQTSVTSITTDKEGWLWFSSLQDGLGYIKNSSVLNRTMVAGLSSTDNFKSITNFNNSIVLSTNLGKLIVKDVRSNKQTIYTEPNETHIDALFNWKNQKLYAGSTYLLELNNKKFRLDTVQQVSAVKDITADALGNIYVATSFSLQKIDDTGKKSFLRTKRCLAVEAMADNTVYAAFTDGVFSFEQNKVKEFRLNAQSIYAVSLAASGDSLAIATVGNGVLFFKQGKLIKQLTVNKELLNTRVIKIKIIDGNIWMLGDRSIDCFNRNGLILHYTFGNEIEINSATDFIVLNQKIYLVKGNCIYHAGINEPIKQATPDIFIDRVNVKSDSGTFLQKQHLYKYNENNIQFVLSGLSLSSGKKLTFKYRLLGADSMWQITDASHFIIDYPALHSGNYIFQAIAISSNGIESKMVEWKFSIDKPWWLKWWFFSLLFLSICFVFYLVFQLRVKSIKRNNELLLDKLNLQSHLRDSMLTAIKSQMNPHFIFNALNTIQSFIYTSDENKASNYLGKFSDLIRLILDNSQKKTITLNQEIEMLQLYIDLEMMRFENTLEAKIEVDTNLAADSILLPPMLIQPYVENAIKHGLLHKTANRNLKIFFKKINEYYLEIIVEDNGVGRQVSESINKQRRKSYTSFATFANKNRFELLNQTLERKITLQIVDKYNEYKQAEGTIVILRVPL